VDVARAAQALAPRVAPSFLELRKHAISCDLLFQPIHSESTFE